MPAVAEQMARLGSVGDHVDLEAGRKFAQKQCVLLVEVRMLLQLQQGHSWPGVDLRLGGNSRRACGPVERTWSLCGVDGSSRWHVGSMTAMAEGVLEE